MFSLYTVRTIDSKKQQQQKTMAVQVTEHECGELLY